MTSRGLLPWATAMALAGVAVAATVTTSPAASAETSSSGLILYRSPSSMTATPVVVHLWTTDGKGQHAREVINLKPVGNYDAVLGAYLVPDGVVIATRNPSDGNVADIAFVKRGSHQVRVLFSVRGLYSFRPSPDGKEIAYSRSLPIAGKPLLVIAKRDGTTVRTLADAATKTLSWSDDGRRVFAYGVTPDCWFCVFSVASGTHTAIAKINLDNLWGGWPSVSPSGARVAFPDAKGPAGERIYTTSGTFLRNLVGQAASGQIWSPDETQLLLQQPDDLQRRNRAVLFSFKTKRATPFVHAGPGDLVVLDWR